MEQIIELGNTDRIVFNGNEVLSLILNEEVIWGQPLDDEQFNYTAIDINGNMQGQLAYDGNPVGYAIGKPTITISEDGLTETISYSFCNGYSSEFYGGYDFGTQMTTDEEYIVPEELVIPSTYKGLPVTTILDYAFYGGYQSEVSFDGYQAHNIKSIVFNNNSNIEIIKSNCFCGIYATSNIELPTTLKEIHERVFYQFGTSTISVTIPENVELIGGDAFKELNANKIIYKAINATHWTGGLYDTAGMLNSRALTTIIFESSVESLTGNLFTIDNNTLYMPQTFVFMHSTNAQITLNLIAPKVAVEVTIYTDNTTVKNYDWSTNANITPTFKPLSEYTG